MTSVDRHDEGFLGRWSRLKEEARAEPPAPAPAAPPAIDAEAAEAPIVPPVEELTLASDYRPFFHPKIEEGVRRAALKKLFSDPHFNVMDGLDVYIDDYSKSDPLPEAMLAQLEQAKKILAWAQEDTDARAAKAAAEAAQDPTAVIAAAEPQGEPQLGQSDVAETLQQEPAAPDEDKQARGGA